MFSSKSIGRSLKRAPLIARELRRGIVTEADVSSARNYCEKQLQHGDYDAYLIRRFLSPSARDLYDAVRTLNLELARLPETVSTPTIGQFRVQFWRDTIDKTFAGNPPREPISILLHNAISAIKAREGGSASSLKFWLLRLVNTREKHMEDQPFTSLAALEEYGENTYATLMYMTLASMSVRSMDWDHLASHVGKACGIVAILRGIPVLAAPSKPIQGPTGTVGSTKAPALLLPLDIMAESGVREEDVFRHGPGAEGLQDAVFKVATRANDHLITAREMLENLKAGKSLGHDFEHEGEAGHVYPEEANASSEKALKDRAFGVLLESIPAGDYLSRLEKANFDPFRVKSSWNLPWQLWRASSRQKI
ncbi:Squalene/phytoene synthase [Podospora aff. communis PSN243]|uniref:Squalene/phytoene synthase n=1 Tax=Podospora aff. communis PSN243 TaxID=3040156 RepID=A0AAV9G5I6_9PEZI|nr:Squalene/phytoene synthase [Podospora aff. communis PSN243]